MICIFGVIKNTQLHWFNSNFLGQSDKLVPECETKAIPLQQLVPFRRNACRSWLQPIRGFFFRGSAVCFAFGQTGAGKTYTLLGSKSEPGMYQLAGADLFNLASSRNRIHGLLHVWASYYEIYCGQLYDLLNKRKRFIFVALRIGLVCNDIRDVKAGCWFVGGDVE